MTRGEPDARERARPVRRAGSGKQIDRKVDTAPRPDPYYGLRDGEIRCLAEASG